MSSASSADTPLPNARARRLMLAIQDVMGQSGLATVLRQAGLQRYASALPPADEAPGLKAAELAGLMQAIENYYGRGARGTLTRVGAAAFKRLVADQRLRARAFRTLLRLRPAPARKVQALRWLAAQTADRGHPCMTVHYDGQQVLVVDGESVCTAGRTRDTAICWVTLGEIQEALKWGTGREFDVVEARCRAQGDAECRFEVGEALD
jgi:predicted hydrocarbon binding protein